MDKIIRKAIRCFVIEENKVIVIQYKQGNRKAGYYDIPGGKIEDGESSMEAAIREMKEETKVDVIDIKHKGIMHIKYSDREYIFDIFFTNKYSGVPSETEENFSKWISIEEVLKQDKILSNLKLLDKKYIKGLIDDNYNFYMEIKVDEEENILSIEYKLEEINEK